MYFFFSVSTVDYSLNLDTCSGSAEEAENHLCGPSPGGLYMYFSMCVFVFSVIKVMLFSVCFCSSCVGVLQLSLFRHVVQSVSLDLVCMCLCVFVIKAMLFVKF